MLRMKMKVLSHWILIVPLILCQSCNWPYSPEQEPYPDNTSGSENVSSGTIYSINKQQQICNPSVSQNQTSFPACMLWLGFSGQLVVIVPPEDTAFYKTVEVKQHDRLTIIDTSNTVRWYIFREDLGIDGHIQDPEWSAHPDYIVCLGENSAGKWDGYVIRLSDKKYLKFCENRMSPSATPHLWLPDSITSTAAVSTPSYDTSGFIKREHIVEFFNTENVKIVYAEEKQGLSLSFIDYNDSVPLPKALVKPEGKESQDCESPLISNEGNWIVYNCRADMFTYSSYMQKLSSSSEAKLVAEKGSDPHWWIDRSGSITTYYIIYTELNGSYVVPFDLSDKAIEQNASAGKTYKRKLSGSAGDVPEHMGLQVDQSSVPRVIANLPFRGGLSRDGRFLSTGYLYGYLLKLK